VAALESDDHRGGGEAPADDVLDGDRMATRQRDAAEGLVEPAEGVVDGAAAVMGQADVLLFPVPLVVADRALEDSGLSFEDLDAAFGVGDGSRIAFLPGSVWELVRTAVSAWLGGGSVVVFGDEVTLDRRTALCEQEGANLR